MSPFNECSFMPSFIKKKKKKSAARYYIAVQNKMLNTNSIDIVVYYNMDNITVGSRQCYTLFCYDLSYYICTNKLAYKLIIDLYKTNIAITFICVITALIFKTVQSSMKYLF